MKKILRSIILAIAFSVIFACASYAKPVITYIMPDKYQAIDNTEIFYQIYDAAINQDGSNFPIITDVKKVESPASNSNIYMGKWGDYSTIVFQENASNGRLVSIIVSTPSQLFSDNYIKKYGQASAEQFVDEISSLQGFFESANVISDDDKKISREKSLNCLNKMVSDSFYAGKMHYDFTYEKNTVTFTLTAFTDDGK